MGISGLLPLLKDATTNVNVKQFEGCTVAIDTYCWIYRGAFSCAEDLALGRPADGHVKYVTRYVNKLLEWNIKPILIFDGSVLPSKKHTELKRKESKEMYRKKASQCLKEGRANEARECFQRCIECTPQMALEVIKAVHKLGVDVLVAPYEADAQLAFLSKANIAQVIITEDSDLIPFGCEKILYKMDINGNGQLIEKNKIISVTQFDSPDNFERFRWMCILSGCDYLENLPGIGLGKAKKFLKTVKKSDIEQILKQMPKVLKMPNLIITNDYIENFKRADNTFKYQIVFDPLSRKQVSLHSYQDDITKEELTYAGFFYDDKLALQHSLGNIDVNARVVVYDFDPEKWNYKPPIKFAINTPCYMKSIWSSSYSVLSNFKKSDIVASFFGCKKENQTKSMPNTFGQVKVLNTKALVQKTDTNSSSHKTVLTENFSHTNTNTVRTKRRLVEFNSNNDNSDQDESSSENKKCKTDNIKCDIDDLLSQYNNAETSLNISVQTTQNLDDVEDATNKSSYESSSSYFSSSFKKCLESPILNKSSQKSQKSGIFKFESDDSQPSRPFKILSNSKSINNEFEKIDEKLEQISNESDLNTKCENDSSKSPAKTHPVHSFKNTCGMGSPIIISDKSSYFNERNSESSKKIFSNNNNLQNDKSNEHTKNSIMQTSDAITSESIYLEKFMASSTNKFRFNNTKSNGNSFSTNSISSSAESSTTTTTSPSSSSSTQSSINLNKPEIINIENSIIAKTKLILDDIETVQVNNTGKSALKFSYSKEDNENRSSRTLQDETNKYKPTAKSAKKQNGKQQQSEANTNKIDSYFLKFQYDKNVNKFSK